MSAFKNVLLIGASGSLGSVALKAFLESQYNVTVLTRLGSTSTFPPSVRVVKADYNSQSSLEAAMQGQDVVISMVFGAAAGDQNPLIDAAVSAGVKRFFPSEYGPDTPNTETHKVIASLSAKVQAVDYLRTKESKMEWTSLVTGGWLDWGLKGKIYPFDFKSRTATILDDGEAMFTATILKKVAKALVAILDNAEATRNTYVYVSSFEMTQNQLLHALEKVDGQKWNVKHENSEDIIQQGKEIIAQGNYDGTLNLVVGLMFGKLGLGHTKRELWNERLGLEADDLDQTLKEIVSEIK
ncbi:isoflavone reductase [Stagonosporopsis vannaccii]|nr:isoflavone reductase [Stagonosporopsis vannaccii]